MARLEDCTCYKDVVEIALMLSQLTKEQRAKVHGIIIGMELAREVSREKKGA